MKIVHIIDTLAIGGAEQLLSGVIQSLAQIDHTVVYLNGQNDFKEELSRATIVCLNYHNRLNTISAVIKLKRILKSIQPDIIHSHLPTATYLTRLVNYKNCNHYFTVHNCLSESIFKKSKMTWLLERWLYNKEHHAIFVSNVIKEDYEDKLGLIGSYSILHNYVDNRFFEQDDNVSHQNGNDGLLRFVSVGTLKEQKNHIYLIESFAKLPSDKYQLDIIGSGPQETLLREKILELHTSNVHLRMSVRELQFELKKYDFFVLASKYEGFGIAPIEAMALGIPLILSNIEVLREVSNEYALFFDIHESESLTKIIQSIPDRITEIKSNSVKGRAWAKEMFSLDKHTNKLLEIYRGGL
jgi:glycosyltransferase involved in cell wall biosynthesis